VKLLQGFKMFLFSVLLIGLGGLEQSGVIGLVPAGFEGATMVAIGVIVGWLRTQTTTPMFTKE
jgi:hypothetical protein